jgi:hypothetical protein
MKVTSTTKSQNLFGTTSPHGPQANGNGAQCPVVWPEIDLSCKF